MRGRSLINLALVGSTAFAAQCALPETANPEITTLFSRLSRNTNWNPLGAISLNFSTYHCEGLAITPTRLFLSSVQVTESTQTYPTPINGLDRTPGKGIGHIFVLDHAGNLEKDIVIENGDSYHPGGLDYDGKHVWVTMAEYRPNSAASVFRIDAETLEVAKQFDTDDHFGGIVWDREHRLLIGNNWGSRNWTAWKLDGTVVAKWANPDFYTDYQDCQYVHPGKAACSGVATLSSSASTKFELGGIALIDLAQQKIINNVPVSRWSKVGHSVNRNPFSLFVGSEGRLNMWVAPDDGTETGGTQILQYEVK
ncbi:hypothetical protein CONLIGDRAFT_699864 [Coniochaeta ligniaria NRRL 30616]|uniref:Uncharacterized protein n=1 Tax=Coniochaeta ligniaria NRRL 30616 TaxID=1408157 RepID=A0A1J7JAV2_9PEZI|nr:hypothetical protein CONLIGDRAFT_699864 [Coniochaeta ligniaria NRRL 30616]